MSALLLLLPQCFQTQTGDTLKQGFRTPRIHKSYLLNGLRILSSDSDKNEDVVISLVIKAGSFFDYPDKEGCALMTAHGLFDANQKIARNYWQEEMERLGVQFLIRTGPDAVEFRGTVPEAHFEKYLELLSYAILHPDFEENRLELLKRQIKKTAIGEASRLETAKTHFRALVFSDHPYAETELEGPAAFQNINTSILQGFYDTHYLANNAALVAVGGISHSRVLKAARELLGSWRKLDIQERRFFRLRRMGRFSIVVLRERSPETALVFGHLGPPRVTRDFYSLEVLNAILSGIGPDSKLRREFQTRRIDFQLLGSQFEYYREAGQFQVVIELPGDCVASALGAVRELMELLRRTKVEEAELDQAKQRLISRHRAQLRSQSLLTDQIIDMELYSLAADFLASFEERIEAVTAAKILEAAKIFLDPRRALVVVVGDPDGFLEGLERIAPVQVLERTDPEL